MAKARRPDHFVVDGSNIATEGRNQPSLDQLNEAVMAFIDERPSALVTVVVDATFGHRIDKKEVKAFDEAVANNELVTPPAGAVGRGDAFVLSIANKAGAGVLSNDSFQEFHGEYDWLFEEGRLIGGKPVPHVGWVFVARTPVRGPKSRQSVQAAKDDVKTEAKERANQRVRAKTAETPAERPATGRSRRGRRKETATVEEAEAPAPSGGNQVNELMPFLEFVEHHPVGTSCTGVVESYASHGAYARVGEVLIYIPLRLMDDPPPRSARKALKVGEAVALVIVGFVPDRRSVDAALPHMAAAARSDGEPAPAPAKKSAAKQPAKATRATKAAAKKTPAKKARAKKATTGAPKTTGKKTSPKQTQATKQPAAEKTPAKKSAARKTPAKKSAARKTPAKQTAAKQTAAKRSPAKQTAADKTAAKQTAAKKPSARRPPAKKPAGKRAAAKRSTGS
jgi:hypothetical protein